jgi:hypothetical protein
MQDACAEYPIPLGCRLPLLAQSGHPGATKKGPDANTGAK